MDFTWPNILTGLVRGEDVDVVPLIDFVIGEPLDHHGCLLLGDDARGL